MDGARAEHRLIPAHNATFHSLNYYEILTCTTSTSFLHELSRLISSFVARFRSIGADPLAGLLREMFPPATWPCDLNHPVRPSLSRTSVHLRGACRKQNGREPRQLAHLLGATLCLSRPYMLHVSAALLPVAPLFAHQDPFVAIGGKAAAPVSHAEDGDTQMASACDVLSARAMLRGGAQPIQLVTSTGRSVSLGPIAERAPTGHVRSRGIGLRSACSCTSTKYYLLDGSLYIECTPSNPCVRTFNAWENEA